MSATVKKDLAEAREVCPTTSRRLLAEGALLVDVREPAEVDQLAFADCEQLRIPLSELERRWAEIPRDRDVILACAVGQRSLKATYWLMYQGYERVMNMQYGMQRWAACGFPVTGQAEGAPMVAGSCCDSAEPAAEGSACCDAAKAPASGCCG
ncbi:rhodanese-like domain-containing protein [Roseomonas eburnea]|uniref:Rhodanese-like domain-containing protein n=1 Tax=Neoroseomonas eburnea TaxID=1346889 RepID=A0A9X9XG28_9PROT|nr:rhodanese-like domain-containing protein [Neoroseomonas eburnea]MBR0682664.1 rhodanese-like domain-containing protein [Neoroseomonas eburnea]